MYSGCIKASVKTQRNLPCPQFWNSWIRHWDFLPMICNLHAADIGHTRYTRSACSAQRSACSWGRHRRAPQTGAVCCLVKKQNSNYCSFNTGLYYWIEQIEVSHLFGLVFSLYNSVNSHYRSTKNFISLKLLVWPLTIIMKLTFIIKIISVLFKFSTALSVSFHGLLMNSNFNILLVFYRVRVGGGYCWNWE